MPRVAWMESQGAAVEWVGVRVAADVLSQCSCLRASGLGREGGLRPDATDWRRVISEAIEKNSLKS